MPSNKPGVLQDAAPQQLEQAAAHNHSELFSLNAIAQGGGVQKRDGLTWTYAPAGGQAMVTFPSLTAENAGERLDDMMNWYRAHPPKNAGCWSLDPPQPADLGIRLLARGFQPGWRPCWMALDLQQIKTGFATPATLIIQADNTTATDPVKDLPYAGDNGAISQAMMQQHPERAQRFIAWLDGKIVAHSAVFFNSGQYGVAGLYNVGVAPPARNQGIGKAVVTAACLYAKEKGYRYAILNGTGQRMYNQVGFEWIGYGCTWWLMSHRYITHPPSAAQVALAEAIGKGDIAALDELSSQFTIDDLNTPITNRMTLMQLAAHCKQPASAEWLMQHGAAYTVLDAWDMGWKDRAAALLKAHPEQVNHRYGDWRTTLLHIAAERNDVALAELALQASPNLDLTDAIYKDTALGWAKHLHRETIIRLIERHIGFH